MSKAFILNVIDSDAGAQLNWTQLTVFHNTT